jgi:SAM-dependent methyltransferase
MHIERPSDWVRRFAPLIRPSGTVLDLACGGGRHVRYMRTLGLRVVAVDRDATSLAHLRDDAGIDAVCADLEGAPWPFSGRRFDGVVVTNYLHRPLFPLLRDAVADEGVLIYETFAAGNERFGRPSNPAFLLRPGELLEELAHDAAGLRVIAFEQGEIAGPRPAVVQRICVARSRLPAPLRDGSGGI